MEWKLITTVDERTNGYKTSVVFLWTFTLQMLHVCVREREREREIERNGATDEKENFTERVVFNVFFSFFSFFGGGAQQRETWNYTLLKNSCTVKYFHLTNAMRRLYYRSAIRN